jgi:transcription elongation factor Elf1
MRVGGALFSLQRLRHFVYALDVDERQFFTEKPEQRSARFQCPRCRRTNDYSIRWMRRTKKPHIPSGADARDRTLYAKVKDHLIRIDDDVTCKTCGKRFEIPSHRALVFVEELEGLPQVDEFEDEES